MNVSDVSFSPAANATGLPSIPLSGQIGAGILPTLGGILHVGDWASVIVTLLASGNPVRWWVDWSDDPNMLFEHISFSNFAMERDGAFHLLNQELGLTGVSVLLPVRAPFMKITANGSTLGNGTLQYSVRGTMEGGRAPKCLPNPFNGTVTSGPSADSASLIVPSTDGKGAGVAIAASPATVEHNLKPYFGRAHLFWNFSAGATAGTNISILSYDQNKALRTVVDFVQRPSDPPNGRLDLNLPGDWNTILYRNGEAAGITVLASLIPEQN